MATITMDEAAAIAELSGLSKNARLWLMDRIGNRLQGVTLNNSLGRCAQVEKAIDGLMNDMQRIGLFEMRRLRG